MPLPVTFPLPILVPAPVPFAVMVTTLSAAWVVAVPAYFPMNTIGFFTAVAAAEAIAKASTATARIESFLHGLPLSVVHVLGLMLVALRRTSIGAAAVTRCGKARIVKGATYGLLRTFRDAGGELHCERFGALAQLGERRLCKAEVAGSIPARSTSLT